jgi:hypothetical protein
MDGIATFTMVTSIATACEEFSTDELDTAIRFLEVMTEQQRKAAARLSD